MPGEPVHHLRMLVDGVVVENEMNDLACRHLRLDGIEEADELLMPMALHAAADDGTFRGHSMRRTAWSCRCACSRGSSCRLGLSSSAGRAGCGRAPEFGSLRPPPARPR